MPNEQSRYSEIVDRIEAHYKTILRTALPDLTSKVYDYEPEAITGQAAAYFIFTRVVVSPEDTNGEMVLRWTLNGRFLLKYSDNETAERRLRKLLPIALAAFGTDLTLGGALPNGGETSVEGGIGGYLDIGKTRFRLVEIEHTIIERLLYEYAIQTP